MLSIGDRFAFVFKKYISFAAAALNFKKSTRKCKISGDYFYFAGESGLASLQRVYCDSAPLAEYVKPGSTIIDVGANIGQFAYFSSHYLKASKVLSIEPTRSSFDLLRLNARPVDSTYCGLVMQKEGMYEMHCSLDSSQLNTVYRQPGQTYGKAFQVKGASLDSLASEKDYAKIDLLKIDAEGAEMDVLKSASDCLSRTSAVYIELGYGSKRGRDNTLFEAMSLLDKHGFALADIMHDAPSAGVLDAVFVKKHEAKNVSAR